MNDKQSMILVHTFFNLYIKVFSRYNYFDESWNENNKKHPIVKRKIAFWITYNSKINCENTHQTSFHSFKYWYLYISLSRWFCRTQVHVHAKEFVKKIYKLKVIFLNLWKGTIVVNVIKMGKKKKQLRVAILYFDSF